MSQKNKKNQKEEELVSSGQPNWPVLIPIIVIFVILLGLVFFL